MRHHRPDFRNNELGGARRAGDGGEKIGRSTRQRAGIASAQKAQGQIFGQITDKLARDVVARILALADESSKPIHAYVNSPGGHVESGDTIHDINKFVRSSVPIYMIGTG